MLRHYHSYTDLPKSLPLFPLTGAVLPTTIDHVYLASMSERDLGVPLVAGAHCAERSCAPFESAGRESGTSFWGVSDHCPIYFEIADEDRD